MSLRMVAIFAMPLALLTFVVFLFREGIVQAVGEIWGILLVGGLFATIFLGLTSSDFTGFRWSRDIDRMRTATLVSIQLVPVIVFLLSGFHMFAFGWLPILSLMLITSASAGLYLRGGEGLGEQ